MTSEEKTALAGFIDITGDYLRDGYARLREAYTFSDDTKGQKSENTARPQVIIIGEDLEKDEGPAGQLLDKMLASIGLYRDKNCLVAGISEGADFLDRQIERSKPFCLLCVGEAAVRHLLKTEEDINSLRGNFDEYKSSGGDAIPVLPSYHPSDILKDESLKRPAWEDLKTLKAKLNTLNTGDADGVS
ncbi:uracil-DNA glycosylase [Leadbettera azotonutricia]|uniref:DNA polymerase domain protein n=1 Tax=Leadbettera azotonutricia (strain ATCC BAA-888 / DSM 13862 / ZAS-9) TaxID=545695 RepID=F5YA80_LEAAZ|nr:uracil-DNA glycosylase [Leadbettera azotonutricia]AEF82518.1 DNA polymerase domain protein [Leadbettera azotonutricia ZAS-9]